MVGFLGLVLCIVLLIRLCPDRPLARQLNERLAEEPLAWLAAMQRTQFVYFIVFVVMLVAAGELIALPGTVELPFFFAVDFAAYVGSILAISVVAAVYCRTVAHRPNRTDPSFWHIRALEVSSKTFGKCARRKRGSAPLANNDDDPSPAFVIAA